MHDVSYQPRSRQAPRDLTSGLVGKPYAKEGVADLSSMAIGKDEDLPLIEFRVERAGEGCQRAISGRQGDGGGQERSLERLSPTEVAAPCTKLQCDTRPARRTGASGPLDQGYRS